MAYIAYFCKSLKVSIPLDLEETEKLAALVFQKLHQFVCIFFEPAGFRTLFMHMFAFCKYGFRGNPSLTIAVTSADIQTFIWYNLLSLKY